MYGKALGFLNQRRYRDARKLFLEIRDEFPAATEVLGRVNTFLTICETQLKKKKETPPTTAEEFFDLGVLYHNEGQYEQALECFSSALKLTRKDSSHIHYAMAATQSQLGNVEKALKSLRRSIELREENRFFARNDPDFEPLAKNDEYRDLVGLQRMMA